MKNFIIHKDNYKEATKYILSLSETDYNEKIKVVYQIFIETEKRNFKINWFFAPYGVKENSFEIYIDNKITFKYTGSKSLVVYGISKFIKFICYASELNEFNKILTKNNVRFSLNENKTNIMLFLLSLKEWSDFRNKNFNNLKLKIYLKSEEYIEYSFGTFLKNIFVVKSLCHESSLFDHIFLIEDSIEYEKILRKVLIETGG